MPAALEVNWEEIKAYMLATGSSFEDTAQRFSSDDVEVSHWAIRKRAEREDWPLPEKVIKKAREIVAQRTAVQAVQTTQMVAENWLEKGEQSRAMAWKISEKPLKALADGKTDAPEVKTWQDVAAIVKLNRQAAGLDTGESTVSQSFNFTMLGERMGEIPPAIEVQGEVRDLPE